MTSATTHASDSQWQIIAGLRFMLAMVVVAAHLTWFLPGNSNPLYLQWLGGTSAVVGFLIVSGYSIGHSLAHRPGGFIRRRLLRIYPLYVLAILFALLPCYSGETVLVAPGQIFVRPTVWVVLGNLLMLQNVACQPIDSVMLVWTLGIEVICYLFAPLMARRASWKLVIMTAISASAFAYYPHSGTSEHYSKFLFGLPLLMFAWAWIAGFLLHRHQQRLWVGLLVAGLACVMMSVNRTYYSQFSIPCAGAAALVVSFARFAKLPNAAGKIVNCLGDLSYPIYLFHLPTFVLGYCIMNVRSEAGLTLMALLVSAAFLLVESILKPVLGRMFSNNNLPTAG